jgi:hypothetical protein
MLNGICRRDWVGPKLETSSTMTYSFCPAFVESGRLPIEPP